MASHLYEDLLKKTQSVLASRGKLEVPASAVSALAYRIESERVSGAIKIDSSDYTDILKL
jgi:hypothetical protein